jgi:hypothetical protein
LIGVIDAAFWSKDMAIWKSGSDHRHACFG